MTDLSIDVVTHVVLTISKIKHFITQSQFDAIIELSGSGDTKGVQIGESFLSFSNITDIVPINDYYEQFPAEKPQDTTPTKFIERAVTFTDIFREADIEGKIAMLRGVKKYCETNPGSQKAELLLKKLELSLKKESIENEQAAIESRRETQDRQNL